MKTEKKLLELEKEISQINVTFKELVHELHKEETDQQIDFDKIIKYSKNKAFSNHYITTLDDALAYKFCFHLAGAVELLQGKEEKVRQYYFIARIIAASNAGLSLEHLTRDSRLISASDFEALYHALSQDGKLIFLINLLLMISFDGKINDAQLDYFCEMASFFAIGRDTLKQVFQTVKGLLTAQDLFYDCAGSMPLNDVSCFLANNPYDFIVTRKAEIASCAGEKIIVCGIHFKNKELKIDHYRKTHITFRNCTFEKMTGIISSRTAVAFTGCRFLQCCENRIETANADGDSSRPDLFSFRTAKLSNCYFEDCELVNKKGISILLNLEHGEICDSVFKNCRVSDEGVNLWGGEKRWNCATIIRGNKTLIRNCQFLSCCAYSNNHYFLRHLFTDNQCMHIVTNIKGTIEQCKFEGCKCIESHGTSLNNANRYYYLINNIHGMEQDNVFERYDAKMPAGTIDWEYYRQGEGKG